MTDNLLFSFCIFTMLATLGYSLYLKKHNQKKIDTILFRSLGGLAFLTFCALGVIIGDDELGIFGWIYSVYVLEIMLIMLTQAGTKRKNIGIYTAFLISTITSCFLAFEFHKPHWSYTIFAIPILMYFIFYGIAKVIENKSLKKICIILSLLIGILCCLCITTGEFIFIYFTIPILIYFIFYGIARIVENKLPNKFPLGYYIITQLSLYLLILNIILILGIAVYDHHIFGNIKPFWK